MIGGGVILGLKRNSLELFYIVLLDQFQLLLLFALKQLQCRL